GGAGQAQTVGDVPGGDLPVLHTGVLKNLTLGLVRLMGVDPQPGECSVYIVGQLLTQLHEGVVLSISGQKKRSMKQVGSTARQRYSRPEGKVGRWLRSTLAEVSGEGLLQLANGIGKASRFTCVTARRASLYGGPSLPQSSTRRVTACLAVSTTC